MTLPSPQIDWKWLRPDTETRAITLGTRIHKEIQETLNSLKKSIEESNVFGNMLEAKGADLDRLAANMGLRRNPGEGDESLRDRARRFASGKDKAPDEVFMGSGKVLGEMRLPRKGKQRSKHEGPILHLWVPRPPKKPSREQPRVKLLSIFSCTNQEIQDKITEGAEMFSKDQHTAERFQNILFAELHRRLNRGDQEGKEQVAP